jgi:ribosomal protein S18 acetylase RimI-like enzyme
VTRVRRRGDADLEGGLSGLRGHPQVRDRQAMTPDAVIQPAAEIRRLHPGDWAAAREIRLTALAQAPDAFASSLEREQAFDEQEWRRRLADTAHFGAWVPGPSPELVGLVATFPESEPAVPGTGSPGTGSPGTGSPGTASPSTARPAARAWHLVAMWVSPDRRGQGIADRLVAAVCDLAQAQGGEQVALWVADANPRAQAVYRRHGFLPSGERGVLHAGGPGRPDLWEARMTRDLGGRPGG